MMASTLSGYFTIVGLFILIKYNMPTTILVDVGFLVAVVVVMLASNVEIQRSVCGEVDPGTILSTLAPWTMLGAILALLRFFPGWKKPFANTFGYLFMVFADGGGNLRRVHEHGENWSKNTRLKTMLEESPNALLYEMQYKPVEQFQTTIEKLSADESVGKITNASSEINDLVSVLLLKDLIGEMVWYMLVGAVAITVSYNVVVSCKSKMAQVKL